MAERVKKSGFPVALFCTCGLSATYNFATQDSADEYQMLWYSEHQGEGHVGINQYQFRQVARNKKLAAL